MDISFELHACRRFQYLTVQRTRGSVPSAAKNWGLHATSSFVLPNRDFINHNMKRDKGLRTIYLSALFNWRNWAQRGQVTWPRSQVRSRAGTFKIIFAIWFIEITFKINNYAVKAQSMTSKRKHMSSYTQQFLLEYGPRNFKRYFPPSCCGGERDLWEWVDKEEQKEHPINKAYFGKKEKLFGP